MTVHAHTWLLIDGVTRRYRCECGAIGHALPGRRGIVPYQCQHELGDRNVGRTHCGKPATLVTGLRTQSRCTEHRPHPIGVAS